MVLHTPSDIIETIVDILHDDKRALTACTLVSSAWLPRSRFNLFRSLAYSASLPGRGFTPFLDFLQSSPELASLVRVVTLDGLSELVNPRLSYKNEILSYSTLLNILDSLPDLSKLNLWHIGFPRPSVWTDEEYQRFETGTRRKMALHKLTLFSIGYIYPFDLQFKSSVSPTLTWKIAIPSTLIADRGILCMTRPNHFPSSPKAVVP